jgi:hypothetical protein
LVSTASLPPHPNVSEVAERGVELGYIAAEVYDRQRKWSRLPRMIRAELLLDEAYRAVVEETKPTSFNLCRQYGDRFRQVPFELLRAELLDPNGNRLIVRRIQIHATRPRNREPIDRSFRSST